MGRNSLQELINKLNQFIKKVEESEDAQFNNTAMTNVINQLSNYKNGSETNWDPIQYIKRIKLVKIVPKKGKKGFLEQNQTSKKNIQKNWKV